MSKEYYWLGGILLGEGSIVLPGNWSRLVRQTPGHPWALLEEVYENVRRNSFTKLPSRRESIFVCETKNNAIEFQAKAGRKTDILYEVTLCDKTAKTYRLDVSVVNPFEPGSGRTLTSTELANQAALYWVSTKAPEPLLPEILTRSPIQIIRMVSNSEPEE